MAIYGFNEKRTAENAAALAKQKPPNQWMEDPKRGSVTWVILTPEEGIPSLTPEASPVPAIPAMAQCELFILKENTTAARWELLPKFVEGTETTTQTPKIVRVFNVATQAVPGGLFLRAIQAPGYYVVDPPQQAITSTMTGFLEECLLKCDSAATVRVYNPDTPPTGSDGMSECGADLLLRKYNLYGGIVFPEINFAGAPFVDLTMQNRMRKDAVKGSAVDFRKAHAADASDFEWQVVDVEDHIARRLLVSYTGETWTYVSHVDGTDPNICGTPNIVCELDCSCVKDGAQAYALYAPKQDRYDVIPPIATKEEEIFVGPMSVYCEDGQVKADQAKKTIKVLDCGDDETPTSELPKVTVFAFGDWIFECLNLCWWICKYCKDLFATGHECNPCTGLCTYRYSSAQQSWIFQSETCEPSSAECGCPLNPDTSGFPANPNHDDTYSIDCGGNPPPPPCTGDCVWEYQSDQSFVLLSNTCTLNNPDCGCSSRPKVGDPDVSPGILPGDTVTRTCGPYVDPENPCCDIPKSISTVDYTADGFGFRGEFMDATKINDCSFNFRMRCFNDDTECGIGQGNISYTPNSQLGPGDQCSEAEPKDDGRWEITFNLPDGCTAETPANLAYALSDTCECCGADFSTGSNWQVEIVCNPVVVSAMLAETLSEVESEHGLRR